MNSRTGLLMKLLKETGAIITDSHFVYASGKHGSAYVNKDAIYPNTHATTILCRTIAGEFLNDGVEAVIGPEKGGIILSQLTAHQLFRLTGRSILSVYSEKDGAELTSSSYGPLPPKHEDRFVIRRGYDKLIWGKRVLIVEDVLTTGGTVRKVAEATRAVGGEVVGVGAICNRGGIRPSDINVPKLTASLNLNLEAWNESECPLCKAGVPINTEVGKGREFLARRT